MKITYEVRYIRKDGSFGAYCGDDKEAFDVEIKNCERCGFEYEARIKKEKPKNDSVEFYYKLWRALEKSLANEDELGCHANAIIVQLGRSVDSNYKYYDEKFNAWLDYFLN